MWISARCRYFWQTVPFLQRDPSRPEDIITTGPDHAADAVADTRKPRPAAKDAIFAEDVHDLRSTRLARKIVRQFPEGAKVTQRAFLAEFRKYQPISNKDGAALHRYATNATDPDQNGGR